MISTTFNSTAVFLLNERPDWSRKMSATFEVLTQFEEGLTGREARRQHAATLRTRFRFGTTLEGANALTFSAWLRGYQTAPVLVPFWPSALSWASRASAGIAGGLKVAFKEDWSQWELYTSTEPTWPAADDMVAPVLWGRLESREGTWINATVVDVDVDLTETGSADYALTHGAPQPSAGPSLSGYGTTPRLFPLALDWSEVPEGFTLRLFREQLGFGRAPLETLYPQTNARESAFRTVCQTEAESGRLLRFLIEHGGGATFWTPTWRAAAVMASDLGAGSTALSVVNAAGVSAGDYLAFVQGTGVAAFARVSTIAGNTLNLAAAPGAFAASDTVVAPLILARLERPRLEVSWMAPGVCDATFAVVEVPAEYSPAADETLGTTLGALPTRCYLYEFTQSIGGTTVTTRATSYERNLTLSGNTFTARKIDHGQISNSLFIDRNEVEIRSEVIAGDVLTKLATAQSEAPARLVIRSANVIGATAGSAAVIFTGDIVSIKIRGSRLTARAVNAGTVFDRTFPRFRLQVGCNHALLSTGCGLAAANWRFTATIGSPLVAGYPFAINLTGLARDIGVVPTIGAGWFAGGWVEFGTGANMVRRAILNSTAVSGGAFQITLARNPVPFPSIGNTVALYPGCDGAAATCSGKFANFVNFGGHPFLPAANPSLVKMSSNLGGGKK